MAFIEDKDIRVNNSQDYELYTGKDPENKYLEVIVQEQSNKPTNEKLLKAWKTRQANRSVPLLVVFLYQNKAFVCGPSGEKPPVYFDLDLGQVQRMCITGLKEPDRHAANRSLSSILESLGKDLPGINNQGFLADHDLRKGVKERKDWNEASKKAREVLQTNSNGFLKSLGFETKENDNFTNFLIVEGRKRALAVLLKQGESPEASRKDFVNQSPVTYGLSIATKENLPYLIIQSGETLRIYPTRLEEGVGRRGRTETYLEINTTVMSDEDAGYLWLIFSGQALKTNGTLKELIKSSQRFGSNLAEGLRNRIYNEVIPLLAKGIFEAKNLSLPSKGDLDNIYQVSITILFRLLFIAYAEDRDLLPYKSNDEYRRNSLQTIANFLVNEFEKTPSSDSSDSYWNQIKQLFKAVDKGNKAWSVPSYNGGLFTTKKEISIYGHELENLVLTNKTIIPVLINLLVTETEEGKQPVDFRSLSVREFGSVYEGLLDTELGFANENLTLDKNGFYRPAKDDEVIVEKNCIYTLNTSGKRKETASFFTKDFAVNHLLNGSLKPALEDHLKRLDEMDDQEAAKNFFDIKVADIAMGSGHFLVAAIDCIEVALENYRNKRLLPEVSAELQKLRASSKKILGELGEKYELEDAQLIRRLIAKRCIFGVDMNPMAVELARLSIWIHTFVPGLPLSFLDRNLVIGNSLTGVGTLDEIKDTIDEIEGKEAGMDDLFPIDTESILGDARKHLNKLSKISEVTIDEISREREAWKKAEEAIAPAKALCDIICGTRINRTAFPREILDDWDHHKINLGKSRFRQEAMEGLDNHNMLHFPVTFPEVFLRKRSGFDAIIGNPPWEKAIAKEDSFWPRFYPGFDGLSQGKKELVKKELYSNKPDLVELLEHERHYNKILRSVLSAGPFPGMGKGDPDLYKAFCWRFWFLTAANEGRIGVVLPRSVLNAKGSEDFRFVVFKESETFDVTTLVNRRYWVFDMEERYTIALVVIKRNLTDDGETIIKLQGPYQSLLNYTEQLNKDVASFTGAEALSWSKSASLPLLPTQQSAKIFSQMKESPSLDFDDPNSWKVRPMTELHATQDKNMIDLESEERLPNAFPVMKGESFNLWTPDTEIYYGYADKRKVINKLQKTRERGHRNKRSVFSEFSESWITSEETMPCLFPRIAFRVVTNRTNNRTTICALIPPNRFIQHGAPVFLWPRGNSKDCAFLLGILSSIPLDWFTKRVTEVNLTFHIIEDLPIPRPQNNDSLRDRIEMLAGRLACPDERFADWAKEVGVDYGPLDPKQKQNMIFELDAVVAHLYGLSKDQLIHVYETFHQGWDYESRLDATLLHYKDWANKL